MKKTSCALCDNSNDFTVIYEANFTQKDLKESDIFSARRLPDRLHYRLVKCNNCGLVRSNPILLPEVIEKLYKKSSVTYATEIPYLNKTYGKYLQKVIDLGLSKNTFLEIGCGNGFFLEIAKHKGFKKVVGVEPGEKAVWQATSRMKKNILVNFFQKNLFKKNSFDVATCFHTLDHVLDPNQFIADTYAVLKTNGYALFIVHNVNSVLATIVKDKCPIFDIEHTYLYNKKTLKKLFEKHGFTTVDVFEVYNTYPSAYLLRMSPLPKFLKNPVVNILQKSNFFNLPLTFPIGNIGIIAKKT